MAKDFKKEIKELSDIRTQVLSQIEKYNRIAKKVNLESRIAMMEAEVDRYEYDKPIENMDEYVKTLEYCPPVILYTKDVEWWFPSSICPGF